MYIIFCSVSKLHPKSCKFFQCKVLDTDQPSTPLCIDTFFSALEGLPGTSLQTHQISRKNTIATQLQHPAMVEHASNLACDAAQRSHGKDEGTKKSLRH